MPSPTSAVCSLARSRYRTSDTLAERGASVQSVPHSMRQHSGPAAGLLKVAAVATCCHRGGGGNGLEPPARPLSAYPTPDRPRRGLKYRSSDLTDGRDHFFCSVGLAPPGVAAAEVPAVGDLTTGTTRFGFLASLLPRFPLLISISWTVLPAAVRGLTSVLYAAHLRVGALPHTRPG
jgi:hypothetical protein